MAWLRSKFCMKQLRTTSHGWRSAKIDLRVGKEPVDERRAEEVERQLVDDQTAPRGGIEGVELGEIERAQPIRLGLVELWQPSEIAERRRRPARSNGSSSST